MDEEALQPPYLSLVAPFSATTTSVELSQDPRDSAAYPPNLTPNQDSSNPILTRKQDFSDSILEQDSTHSTPKWDPANPIHTYIHTYIHKKYLYSAYFGCIQ